MHLSCTLPEERIQKSELHKQEFRRQNSNEEEQPSSSFRILNSQILNFLLLFVPERPHGVHQRCTARGRVGCRQRDQEERNRNGWKERVIQVIEGSHPR